MRLIITLIVSLLNCGLMSSYPLSVISAKDVGASEDSWDHFIYVQQYPAGFCTYETAEGHGYDCYYPPNASAWTLHGLWPTLEDTKGPNCCNSSATFEVTRMMDLVPRLIADWTNLYNTTRYDSFWEHEWLKHGTCSGMSDQHTYFSTVLDYFEGHKFDDLLHNQGVVPSEEKKYPLSDFLGAFRSELGVDPYHVECQYSKKMGLIMKQIAICLDKSMKVIQCPSQTMTSSCEQGSSIYYPTSRYSTH